MGAANHMTKDIALQLCTEIRRENSGKLSFARFQCWGCTTFSKGATEKMCLASKSDYSGCNLVNTRFRRR